jgi:hypothetical protein
VAEGVALGSAGLSVGIRGRRYPVLLPSLRDPRLRLTAVLWTLQVLGQTSFGFQLSIAQVLIALGTAATLEVLIVLWQRRVIIWPASALITGNGVAFILRVPGTAHGDWWSLDGAWIFAATAAVAILSKHVVRARGRHVFNPSNVALVLCFLLLGSRRVEPQYFWWGPMTVWLGLALVVIAVGALGILSRLGLLRVAVGFWCSFAAGIGVLAISGHSMTARWHLGPIAGFSFWSVLVTSPEVFVFLSFMITDPRTSPVGPAARWRYAVAIGLLASLLIAPQTTEFASKVAVLAALTIVCAAWPLVDWLAGTRCVRQRRAQIAALTGRASSRSRTRTLARHGVAAATGCAAVAALLVVAGIPARPVAASQSASLLAVSTQVSADQLPTVTVVPASDVVAIAHATAVQIARELVVDLRLQADALVRHDPRIAAAGTAGAALTDLDREIRAAAGGRRVVVSSYDISRLRIALIPGPDQSPPTIRAAMAGTVSRTTYADTPARLVARAARVPISETLTLALTGARYLVVGSHGGSAGLPARGPAGPSPVEVALAPGGPSAVPEGDPFSVRFATRLRKPQSYEEPETVVLTITGRGAPPVSFARSGLLVPPHGSVTQVASVTPSEWYPQPGTYRIVATVGGRTTGSALPFRVTAPRITIPRFEDVTKSAGLSTTVPAPGCGEFVTTPAWGQIDQSGQLALFVPRLSAPSQLFVNNGAGHFTNEAAARGLDVRDATGAAFGDYLNNGRQDLFVTRYGAPSLLFRNDGNGRFTNVTAAAGISGVSHASSVTWVDYNNDGLLDLYVTNYMTCVGRWTSGTDTLADVRYYGAKLFRNNGNGTFTNVSQSLPESPKGAGLAAAWFEATGSERQDLYLGNDNVGQDPDHNRLWMNTGHSPGSHFTDVSLRSDTGLYMNTMGIAVGDFERDGRLDFALSNIGGNQLMINNGDGTFASDASTMGVARPDQYDSYPSVTWGVGAYDFTDDGWQDLYFTAGNVNPRLTSVEGAQPSELFLNDDGKRFLDVSAPSGAASAGDAKGVAFADYDRDGRTDMFVLNQDGSPQLYRNVTPLGDNHWLEVQTIGTVSNRDGCGARVLVSAAGARQLREILCAQNEQAAQFGLGSAARVAKLEIIWPSGIRQVLRNVPTDRYMTVTEPHDCARALYSSARCAR